MHALAAPHKEVDNAGELKNAARGIGHVCARDLLADPFDIITGFQDAFVQSQAQILTL